MENKLFLCLGWILQNSLNMKNIAILAHDKLKPRMVQFLENHRDWIPGVKLIATGRTAEFVEKNGVEVEHMSQGRYGGYKQIIEKIENKDVDIVIFLRDPEVSDHHEDIKQLMFTCNNCNIPFATNPASAELLILGLIKLEASKKYQKKN
jgi:methylglyoxal synthase